jgi:Lrp/AsnC family transcriptional regulator for asnA, asnC and gidA
MNKVTKRKGSRTAVPSKALRNGSAGREDDADKISSLALPSDRLNARIIEILQEDGRTPFDVIAQDLGVSPGTVRNRVNWMRKAGMLSIVAVVDPVAVDYAADAMLGIKVASGVAPKDVAEELSRFEEVVYVLWVSGRFDLLVELVCDADTDLAQFLERQVHGDPKIANVEVMTSIAMFKNQFLLKRHIKSVMP